MSSRNAFSFRCLLLSAMVSLPTPSLSDHRVHEKKFSWGCSTSPGINQCCLAVADFIVKPGSKYCRHSSDGSLIGNIVKEEFVEKDGGFSGTKQLCYPSATEPGNFKEEVTVLTIDNDAPDILRSLVGCEVLSNPPARTPRFGFSCFSGSIPENYVAIRRTYVPACGQSRSGSFNAWMTTNTKTYDPGSTLLICAQPHTKFPEPLKAPDGWSVLEKIFDREQRCSSGTGAGGPGKLGVIKKTS